MNHNNKNQEQSSIINESNYMHEHTYGTFQMNALRIWDDLVTEDDHDGDDHDDDIPIKQDYDLDNLYSREQQQIEDEMNSMSEDDDDYNVNETTHTHDQMVLNDSSIISQASNTKIQSIDDERVLSQKFSQLHTSLNNYQAKASSSLCNNESKETVQIKILEKNPDYLPKTDKSFQNMMCSILSIDIVNLIKLENLRKLTNFIHHIKYNETLYSLWTVYLKCGLGELQSQEHYQRILNPILNPKFWPISVKSRVKNVIHSGNDEYDACLNYVKDRLFEIEKDIQQFQSNLYDQINRLPDYLSSSIQQMIEKFVEDKLTYLRTKIQHKIQLVYYDYDERILELQYLQHNPTEAQIKLAKEYCIARQQQELTKHESELLEKRINCHRLSSLSFDNIPISHVPLFDSISNVDVRQQLYAQYRQVIEQSKMDMFNLYINSATVQMHHYQHEYKNRIDKMWQDQRSLPQDQKLTVIMVDLIEQRANVIAERIQSIFNFKAQILSIQS